KGDGTFVDVAAAAGVQKVAFTKGAVWGDYDNDGFPDLYVSNYGQPNFLYHNNRDGTFTDVARALGVEKPIFSFPTWFFDFDNDGFLDFYLGTGSPSYGALVPNLLFRNQDGKRFVDVTVQSGTGHLQKGHGIAFGDYDGDGDQDILLHVGGAVPGDTYSNVLFRNPGNGAHWLRVKLVGRKTNRAAIGARIKAVIAE